MANTRGLDVEKSELEDKIKNRYFPGIPKAALCEVFESRSVIHTGHAKLKWVSSGGGDWYFRNIEPHEKSAADVLLKEGTLVPTFEHSDGYTKFRTLKHFDDVNFGLDENGGIVIFELVKWLPEPDRPDLVIRPDEKYDAVLERLKTRMSYDPSIGKVLVDETPLQLKGGPLIKPIVTDTNRVQIMMRQRELGLR